MTTAHKDFWFQAQKAETLRLSGAYDQAIDAFTKLNKESPENAWVNAHLGATYLQLLDYGNAEEHLKRAVEKNEGYFWAHAQLGETYRLLAIVNNRNSDCIDGAIEQFQKALLPKGFNPEHLTSEELLEELLKSNYAWALAHLGAVYRLKITADFERLKRGEIDEESAKQALYCLNRAIELLPTYAWAWGMRSTVYRLTQEYEDSFYNLEVEVVCAPNMQVLQGSSSPIPSFQSGRVNLYEHAWLAFYQTKKTEGEEKAKWYERATAFSNQALILNPSDLIAKLLLTVVKAEQNQVSDSKLDIKVKIKEFFEEGSLVFCEPCKMVISVLIAFKKIDVAELKKIEEELLSIDSDDEITNFVLKDLLSNRFLKTQNPKLWFWQNYDLVETCTNVIFMLSELWASIGETDRAKLYTKLAYMISPHFTLEKVYQSPVLFRTTSENPFEIFS